MAMHDRYHDAAPCLGAHWPVPASSRGQGCALTGSVHFPNFWPEICFFDHPRQVPGLCPLLFISLMCAEASR